MPYFVRRVGESNELLLQSDPLDPDMDVVEWDDDIARATIVATGSIMQWVTFFPGEEVPPELSTLPEDEPEPGS